ncbi:AcrR family transcriptional regulator [Nocardia transvalensis]|uniref:AcrR family transcriptional regulator n=1 Tax=Nocardia transvalensis TaxID=37333 RepID=A0A7W9PFT2_9NOCA|nr:TetR/AcrR family transcriptional regulator [Nocardia transvalensis]MBB5915201.1 AcrR family transcriptional regulator [Nocardia transvalensis]
MKAVSAEIGDDGSQKRAVPVRARSRASRDSIVRAAMALWRTKGFAETTVTDICKAAGVSKALFYVYFSRREEVLLEAEVFTMRDAHAAAEAVTTGPYELRDVLAAVIDTLVQRTRRYPPELVFETVLETYRIERRALADGATEADLAYLFLTPFRQAQRDGKLRADADITHLARLAQTLVADGIRSWSAAGFVPASPTEPLATEIDIILEAVDRPR